MKENQMQRREFLKIGGAVFAMIPVMVVSGRADAATNAAMRTSLKYQGKPEGDKSCANCMQFVPLPLRGALAWLRQPASASYRSASLRRLPP